MKLRLNLLTLTLTAALLSGTALRAESVMLNTDGTMQFEAELKADFESVGLVFPDDQNLTFGQIQELLVVFDKMDKTAGEPNQDEKDAKAHDATLILSRINTEMALTSTNLGAIQITDELKARLTEVGVALPAMQSLTVAQIRELLTMFRKAYKSDSNPTEAEMTEAANEANMILSRIANPVVAGNDSAAVQVQKDQLKLDMESIGMQYPTDKDLTLDQVVALQAAFDTPDTAAIKGSSDIPGARAKVQVLALTALLGQM